MQEHPVPQNITSFEFKLIGDMTLRQFGFVGSSLTFALIVFFAISGNNLNIYLRSFGWFLIVTSSIGGFALAFIPIEGRPLDRWLVSFFKAVFGNTMYIWHKDGISYDVLNGMGDTRSVVSQPVSSQLSYDPTAGPSMPTQPKNALDDHERQILDAIHATTDQNFNSPGANPRPVRPLQPLPAVPSRNSRPQGYAGSFEPPKTIPSPLAYAHPSSPSGPNAIRFSTQRSIPRPLPMPNYPQPMMPIQPTSGVAMPGGMIAAPTGINPYQPLPTVQYQPQPQSPTWPSTTRPAIPQPIMPTQSTTAPPGGSAIQIIPMPPMPQQLPPLPPQPPQTVAAVSAPTTTPTPVPAPQAPIPVSIVSNTTPQWAIQQPSSPELEEIKKQNELLKEKLKALEDKIMEPQPDQELKNAALKKQAEAIFQNQLNEMKAKLDALARAKSMSEQELDLLKNQNEVKLRALSDSEAKRQQLSQDLRSLQGQLEKAQISALTKIHEHEISASETTPQAPIPVKIITTDWFETPKPEEIAAAVPVRAVESMAAPTKPDERSKPIITEALASPPPPPKPQPELVWTTSFTPPSQPEPHKSATNLPLHPQQVDQNRDANRPKQPAPFNTDLPAITKLPNAISGYVLNESNMPLTDTIIVVKKADGPTVRALKSNRIGQFSIVTPLPDGHYELAFERDGYNFDIIMIEVKGEVIPPIKIMGRKSL